MFSLEEYWGILMSKIQNVLKETVFFLGDFYVRKVFRDLFLVGICFVFPPEGFGKMQNGCVNQSFTHFGQQDNIKISELRTTHCPWDRTAPGIFEFP